MDVLYESTPISEIYKTGVSQKKNYLVYEVQMGKNDHAGLCENGS